MPISRSWLTAVSSLFLVLAICSLSTARSPLDLSSKTFSFVAKSTFSSTKQWNYQGVIQIDSNNGVRGELNETKSRRDGTDVKHSRYIFANDHAVQVLGNDPSEVMCVPPATSPPLSELIGAFAQAIPLPMKALSSRVLSRCNGYSHFSRLKFAGKTFVLCYQPRASLLQGRLIGEDFEADISETSDVALSHVNALSIDALCHGPRYRDLVPLRHDDAHVSDAWLLEPSTAQNTKVLTHLSLSVSSQNQTIVPKPCIFLHGSGEHAFEPPTNTFPDYWGDIENYTPQCTSRTFIHANTRQYGWTAELLQKAYCELALGGQKHTITDKYIFTHSMGNMILAAALNNSVCALGKGAHWFSVAAPARGSGVASYLNLVCRNNTSTVYRKIAQLIGACDSEGNPLPSYESLIPVNPLIPTVMPVLTKYVRAQMCGTSPMGITTKYSAALELVSIIAKLEDPNDGLVEASSCKLSNDYDWRVDPDKPFYLAVVNHADLTCRNGNGWWGSYRQPCTWYSFQGEYTAH